MQGGILSFYTRLIFCSWIFRLHAFKNRYIINFLPGSLSVWATPLNFVPKVSASLAPPPCPSLDKNPQKLDSNLRNSISQVPGNPLRASPDCVSLLLPPPPPAPRRWCLLSGICFTVPCFPLWGHLLCMCPQTSYHLVWHVFELHKHGITLHVLCLCNRIFWFWDSFKSMGIIVVHSFLRCLILFRQLCDAYTSPQISSSAIGLCFAIYGTSPPPSVCLGRAPLGVAWQSRAHGCGSSCCHHFWGMVHYWSDMSWS